MKLIILNPTEINVKKVKVFAQVRYWEDADVNGVADEKGDLIPCRNGNNWEPIIDVDLGKIENWQQGKSADIHYKVCDCCRCVLLAENGEIIAEKDGYVPKFLDTKGAGYGDYIIMKINADGFIENWKFTQQLLNAFID